MVNNAAGVMFMSPYRGRHVVYFVLPMEKSKFTWKKKCIILLIWDLA